MNSPTFVRALWGDFKYWNDKSLYRRSPDKLRTDIKNAVQNLAGINQQCVNYVWGNENHDFLCSLGFGNLRLVSDEGIVWRKPLNVFRHKMEAWRLAAEEFGEFAFLDWDCRMLQPLPANFWERLREKHELQAALMMYAKRRTKDWRMVDARKMPSAAWVYCRNPAHIRRIIEIWETNPIRSPGVWFEEVAVSFYIDELHGGWPGAHRYYETHEPFCLAPIKSALPDDVAADPAKEKAFMTKYKGERIFIVK